MAGGKGLVNYCCVTYKMPLSLDDPKIPLLCCPCFGLIERIQALFLTPSETLVTSPFGTGVCELCSNSFPYYTWRLIGGVERRIRGCKECCTDEYVCQCCLVSFKEVKESPVQFQKAFYITREYLDSPDPVFEWSSELREVDELPKLITKPGTSQYYELFLYEKDTGDPMKTKPKKIPGTSNDYELIVHENDGFDVKKKTGPGNKEKKSLHKLKRPRVSCILKDTPLE